MRKAPLLCGVSQLWPGAVHFPDFFNPQTVSWWTGLIKNFSSMLPLDGLWIDMNEPGNFCTGDVCTVTGEHPLRSSILLLKCQSVAHCTGAGMV